MNTHTGSCTDIDYSGIDVEVRRLVALLNLLRGIRTTSSCAGHRPGDECQVAFRAAGLDALAQVLASLPFTGERVLWVDGHPMMQAVWITAQQDLTFRLHLSGSPIYARRDLVASVESSLANSPHLGPRSQPPDDGNSVAVGATSPSSNSGSGPLPARKSGDRGPSISHLSPKYPTPGHPLAKTPCATN
jgi:hypothetical protein